MALRADIEAEINAKVLDEAAKPRVAGWWFNIAYVFSGRDIVGYRVHIGNMRGFRFDYAQRDERLPADIEEVAKAFGFDVIDEVEAMRGR